MIKSPEPGEPYIRRKSPLRPVALVNLERLYDDVNFVAGTVLSCRRASRFAIHRDDGPLAFEQMAEAQNRAAPVLDVVAAVTAMPP